MIQDVQVRKLMQEMSKHGKVGVAALRSGMDRKTASKYIELGKFPSELHTERTYRTRADPFAEHWSDMAAMLKDAPELEAFALFEFLLGKHPERYQPGQVRTFQRRVKQWRATEGPDKEVFFAQEHRPGEATQTDFTWCNVLKVTIRGVAFEHMLCQSVLPFSNWQWATVCLSESLMALRRQVQQVVFKLGRVTDWHQTDNSTAATHDLETGKRGFNQDYLAVMDHFGLTPRTIKIRASNQNGDVESYNGVLKRRLKQHLLLRGSRDFDSVEAYEAWVQEVLRQANELRQQKVTEELSAMKEVNVERLLEYVQQRPTVSSWSTIRVKRNSYSVPSRLIGEQVRVRVYETRLEVRYAGKLELTVDRLLGRNKHRIDYRHIIWSLVRKPGAFARYKYREELFPSLVFRRAYDALCEAHSGWEADVDYLRILHLSASTMEADVEAALELVLEQGQVPRPDLVKALVAPQVPQVPQMEAYEVDLQEYDVLLVSSQGVGR